MSRALGWIIAIICLISAPVLIILSFALSHSPGAGGLQITALEFFIPIAISWIAVFPRSRKEWTELRTGHPVAQRFFKGTPAGFFGDYRRKLTAAGKLLLYGTIGLFLFCLYLGAVHFELFIIGFLFLVAFTSWIMRLEINGDPMAATIRRIGSAIVYHPMGHHGS